MKSQLSFLRRAGRSVLLAAFVCALMMRTESWATSQFARKYNFQCQFCHTAFPRLNYTGEKFMRDGFQMNQDGDENKEKVNDRLVIDDVKNFIGARLNLQPLKLQTNALTDENGNAKDKLTFGSPNWLQLFVAGSIYKNVSIFIEWEQAAAASKFSWYKLGFHNLFGPEGAANLLIGNQAPMEWMPASGRLRMLPDAETVWGPKGKGEDGVGITGARPGISFYGYQGPAVYFFGAGPGSSAADVNNKLTYWGGLRLEKTSGALEGSAVGLIGLWGSSTSDYDNSAGKGNVSNNYNRYSLQGLLRQGSWDVTAAYNLGSDNNWTLADPAVKKDFKSLFLQAGNLLREDRFAALRYEKLNHDDDAQDLEKLIGSYWIFPRENFKIGFTAALDLHNKGDKKKDEYHVTIRTMF